MTAGDNPRCPNTKCRALSVMWCGIEGCPGGGQWPPQKRPQRLETRRRVEQKSQARNPSAGLERELDERVARDEEEIGWTKAEYDAAPDMANRLHREILRLRDLCELLRQSNRDLRASREVAWQFRPAALELEAEIRSALSWIDMGAEPSVAHHAMRKTADKWLPVLEELEDAPSAKAPTSVARDAPSSTTTKEPPQD